MGLQMSYGRKIWARTMMQITNMIFILDWSKTTKKGKRKRMQGRSLEVRGDTGPLTGRELADKMVIRRVDTVYCVFRRAEGRETRPETLEVVSNSWC